MSVIIAVKDKDRIILGADKQTSFAQSKSHEGTKIWRVADLPDAIMGGVGSTRVNQIIRFAPIINKNEIGPDGLSTSFIINHVVPAIVGTLKSNGIKVECPQDASTPVMSNAFIFAYEDKAWRIWHDFSVHEIDDFSAIGSGTDIALGALFASPDRDPFQRIVTSIDAAAKYTLFVDSALDFLPTKVYEEDQALIMKALEPDYAAECENKPETAAAEPEKKSAAKTSKKKLKKASEGTK